MTPQEINEFAREIHAQNVEAGWWPKNDKGQAIRFGEAGERCLVTVAMLIESELFEGFEGLRKDLMDDKLPHRKMIEVELADFAIRALDLLDYVGGQYDGSIILCERTDDPFRDLLHVMKAARVITETVQVERRSGEISRAICEALMEAEWYSESYKLDMWAAAKEKHAFNRTREDHKLSVRMAAGGKKI